MEKTAKPLVLFDGLCPLCQRSVAILRKLDWFSLVDYVDAREHGNIPAMTPALDPERLLEEMHFVNAGRTWSVAGFKAFRAIAWRLPLLTLIAPFLYLPLIPWVGQKVYLWVARKRYQLVPCKDGVCHLPPSMKKP